jgi:hypothetical protein
VCGFFVTSLLLKCNEYQICSVKKLGFLRMVIQRNNVLNINAWWFHCFRGRYKLYSVYDILGLYTQQFEKPNSSKELSQFQECGAVRNISFFPTWVKYFFVSVAATQSFGPTQPHTQWVLGPILQRWSGRSRKLSIHLHLVPSLRMRGALSPFIRHRDNLPDNIYSNLYKLGVMSFFFDA